MEGWKHIAEKGAKFFLALAKEPEADYAMAIAATLRRDLGASHQGIKTAMRWTGASERTVKNWFATRMPSWLCSSPWPGGRTQLWGARLADLRDRLAETLAVIDALPGWLINEGIASR